MRVALSFLVVAVLAASVSTAAADEPTIANGVSAGGVELAGLTVTAATAKLEAELRPALARDLVVRVAGERVLVRPSAIGFRFDAAGTAKRAAEAGAPPSALDVGLLTTVDPAAVETRASSIARAVRRPSRSAVLKRITSRSVIWQRARSGLSVKASAVAAALQGAAGEPRQRLVALKTTQSAPAVSNAALRARYPSILTVDKRTFKLRLFRGLRQTASYRIAHGQTAYPTPNGRFRIRSKQVNPNWYVPSSPWAGELAGSVVPGGAPSNPLKARWMGLTSDGIGIHGTGDEGSIGTRASHGCIRMRVRDVVRLFRQVRVGTPVVIG